MSFTNWPSDIKNYQQDEIYFNSLTNNNNVLSKSSISYAPCYAPQTPPLYWGDATIVSPMASYNDECLSCCSSLSGTPKINPLSHQQLDMIPQQMVDPMLIMPLGLEIPHQPETAHKDPSHFYFQALEEPISIQGNAQPLYFHQGMAYDTSFSYYNNINTTLNFQQETTFNQSSSSYCLSDTMNETKSHQNTYRYRSFSHSPVPPVKSEPIETITSLDKNEEYKGQYNVIDTTQRTESLIRPIENDNNDSLPGYLCSHPNCNKRFSRPYNLKSHMRTHTSERPFACNYPSCGWKFARPHDLKRHQLQHTGQKPHSCKFCHRRFARSDALKRHWKVDVVCSQALQQEQIASEASLSKEISSLCKKKKTLVK